MSEQQEQPQDAPVATVSFWDAQIRTTAALLGEVQREYTSKDRLRKIAHMSLMHMMAMLVTGQQAEQQAQAAPVQEEPQQSSLILPSTEIVVP
jgi:hypothetical protein